MNLGKQIRQIRQLRELSQEYLGSEIGSDQNAVSRFENNKVSPTHVELLQIAKVLQVKLSFLLQFNADDLLNELQMSYLDEGGVFVMGVFISMCSKMVMAAMVLMLRVITTLTLQT